MIEAIGILASVVILIGFLSKNEKHIRTINIVGCCLFVAYGIAIGSFSVWFVNGALIVVHLYHLHKRLRKTD